MEKKSIRIPDFDTALYERFKKAVPEKHKLLYVVRELLEDSVQKYIEDTGKKASVHEETQKEEKGHNTHET